MNTKILEVRFENVCPELPETLEELHIICCRLNKPIPKLPSGLKKLVLYSVYIYKKTLRLELPDGLEELTVRYGGKESADTIEIPVLPTGLKCLDLRWVLMNNNRLPTLPKTLETLICFACNLITLSPLPPSLIVLDCSCNSLSYLPVLPNNLLWLDCGFNYLEYLPEIPPNIQHMRFNDNCLEYVPGALPHTLKYLVYNNCQTRKPIDEDEDDADEDEDADYDAIPNELDEWKEWSEKRTDVEYLEGLRRQIVDTYNGSREAVGAVIKVIDKQISKLNKP
jgi:Leucine-rich repeat (LRR) protein